MKKVVAICIGAALLALCLLAISSELSIAVKCFAVFASVDGYFELYKWYKKIKYQGRE